MHPVDDSLWRLDLVQVSAGDQATATATLRLVDPGGNIAVDAATGTGPVQIAVYRAMNRITGISPELTEFSVTSVTEGIDAQGEVTIRIEDENKRTYTGRSADADIIVASARAYERAEPDDYRQPAHFGRPSA
ncbi:MAG: alpha-isopropylmalate synthase regulatory domain-containing protein [Dehalococcoidia bacterium]